MRPEDVDATELGVLISTLPPTHALVAAARAGVDVADGRAADARDHRDVQADIHDGMRDLGVHPDPQASQRQWEGRAEVDGNDSYAGRRAAENGVPRAAREPDTAATDDALKQMAQEARDWVAQQEDDEHRRYDYAYGYTSDVAHDEAAEDADERCAERSQ